MKDTMESKLATFKLLVGSYDTHVNFLCCVVGVVDIVNREKDENSRFRNEYIYG